MKYIFVLCFLALFSNCSQNKYSPAECEPVVQQLVDNLSKDLSEKEQSKLNALKSNMMPVLEKECMSGKYELECLKAAKNPLAIQACAAQ